MNRLSLLLIIVLTLVSLISCTALELKSSNSPSTNNSVEKRIVESSPIYPVWLKARGQNKTGQGILVQSHNGCDVLTAGHVVGNHYVIDIIRFKNVPISGNVEYADLPLDLAFIKTNLREKQGCGKLPSPRQLENAFFSNTGIAHVRTITEKGDIYNLAVSIIRVSGKHIYIKPFHSDTFLSDGMSGAPVILDGVIVGIFQKTENDKGIALLINEAHKELRKYFVAYDSNTKINTWPPYDIRQLPKDLQDISSQANRTKKIVEEKVRIALNNEKKIDAAVNKAMQLPDSRLIDGHAHHTSSDGLTVWAGQAKFTDDTKARYTMYKWVERKEIGEKYSGNRTKCFLLEEGGCQGLGIIYYGRNSAHYDLESWHGELKGYYPHGYGLLKLLDGREIYTNHLPNNVTAPGVYIRSDRTRFEGMFNVNTDWNGKGILWDSEGQVIQIGEWKNGKPTVNRNDELLQPGE